MKYFNLPSLLFLSLFSVGAIAATNDLKIAGSIPTTVKLHQGHARNMLAANKVISLQHVVLSQKAHTFLAARLNANKLSLREDISQGLPTSANVGMGNVPVLDQGIHGTCVTFALSAAIDAAYNNSDYISQLCNLELGAFLEKKNPNYPSGWDGSYASLVLNQMKKYGIITASYQHETGCGNKQRVLTEYPTYSKDTGVPMSIAEFEKHEEPVMKTVKWTTLLDENTSLSTAVDMNKVLTTVKTAINNGHRVAFGTMLDVYGPLNNVNGAMGSFNSIDNIAWVLTKQIVDDIKYDNQHPNNPRIDAGHEMVIIGYDDNAVSVDTDGMEHKGILTLRNSWSAQAGDQGNYYMSYDFFKALVTDAQEILPG